MSTKRNKRIILNVSGEIFETLKNTLNRFPDTLLGNNDKRDLYYCSRTNEHFFDRNRLCFEAILYFYQSNGTLNCPPGIEVPIFEVECRYFELPDEIINKMKWKEGVMFELESDEVRQDKVTFQMQIWNILEKPNTSQSACMFGIFSFAMICISIISACLETIPEYQMDSNLPIIELILNIWFLIEFILRFIFWKSKLEFFQRSINWVDIFAVFPYFVMLTLETKATYIHGIFKILKLMRVMRLFRLSKHSRRLKVVGIILKSCLGNFNLLIMCLLMVIILGGSFMYFTESCMDHVGFTSIPQGLWWGVQTITSVGYGDLIPMSIIGRMFACCFMVFGALTMSLPVVTIISQFTTLYPKNVECDAYMTQYKRAQIEEDMKKKHEKTEFAKSGIKIIL